MNSSGLIYAVIVGAWAAYLVPMWLRRQDELNESRPTERFSTAIRLLSGKAAMERRYARESERCEGGAENPAGQGDPAAPDAVPSAEGGAAYDGFTQEGFAAAESADAVDVRAYADPKTIVGEGGIGEPTEVLDTAGAADGSGAAAAAADSDNGSGRLPAGHDSTARGKAEREMARQKIKRAKVLARRRRTTMVLFLAFTAGTIVAAVGGVAFLWAPGVPGLLLSAYIVYLRVTERRRFAATMDKRRRKESAAQERQAATDGEHDAAAGAGGAETEALPAAAPAAGPGGSGPRGQGVPAGHGHGQDPAPGSASGSAAARREQPAAADRRALVEQTDHAEWVDQQRQGAGEAAEGWEPVPVPLPTYVSAPVAPRSTRGVDLEAPGTWSSARSSSAASGSADTGPVEPGAAADDEPAAPRRARGRRQTPLFDQYEGDDRPRAANE